VNLGEGWTRVPVPSGQTQVSNPFEGFDLGPYIKDVRVEEGALVDGDPTCKIIGVIDTNKRVSGALGQLSQGAQGGFDVAQAFGDIRAVLYVSDTSALLKRGLIDFSIDLFGTEVEMHMDFALSGLNEEVRIPKPA
jgi:hypothetical protein